MPIFCITTRNISGRMTLNMLELPREMISEVVNVDYYGLLSLRRTCRLTKDLADEESSKIAVILEIKFWPNGNNVDFRIMLDHSKPPLFLLCYKDTFMRFSNGQIQIFHFEMPNDAFPVFLHTIRDLLPEATIESFNTSSLNESLISQFEIFLDGLTIVERCFSGDIFYGDNKRERAEETMKRLRLNTVKMGVERYIREGDNMGISDAVERLILSNDCGGYKDPVTLAVSILSGTASQLELECSRLTDEQMNETIHKLSQLGKKLYLYAKLDNRRQATRKFVVSSMNVELSRSKFGDDLELEIWHDGMRRRVEYF